MAATEKHSAIDVWRGSDAADGRTTVRMLVAAHQVQPLMDTLQKALGGDEGHRIVLLSALAALPDVDDQADHDREREKAQSASRGELYNEVVQGARIDRTFLLLAFLSTLVAGIGPVGDNVAVIIGAMVIAPLLGPIRRFPLRLRWAIACSWRAHCARISPAWR